MEKSTKDKKLFNMKKVLSDTKINETKKKGFDFSEVFEDVKDTVKQKKSNA